jgi:hypothetical protein
MKRLPSSKHFCSNSLLLLGSLVVLVGACVLLVSLTAISKTFAARIASAQAGSSTSSLSSKNDPEFNFGPASRLDEQGNRPNGTPFLPAQPHKLALSDRLEMEPGRHSGRRAAMSSMPLFRPLLQASLLPVSRPMAASAVRFIVQVTVAIHGPRCRL